MRTMERDKEPVYIAQRLPSVAEVGDDGYETGTMLLQYDTPVLYNLRVQPLTETAEMQLWGADARSMKKIVESVNVVSLADVSFLDSVWVGCVPAEVADPTYVAPHGKNLVNSATMNVGKQLDVSNGTITSAQAMGTKLTNLVANGNFATGDLTGYTKLSSPSSIAYSADGRSGGAMRIIGTTSPATAPRINTPISVIAGHKYYVAAWRFVESGSGGSSLVYLADINGNIPYLDIPQSTAATGAWYRHSAIYTATATRTEYLQYGRASAVNYVARFCDAIVIDLTDAFGEGNEPTQAQVEATLATTEHSWFDGVRTVNVVTGGIQAIDYPSVADDATDYIRVVSGEEYTLSHYYNLAYAKICYYDEDKAFISGSVISEATYTTVPTTFTIPAGACYVRLSAHKIYGTPPEDWQFEAGSTATSYERYYEQSCIQDNNYVVASQPIVTPRNIIIYLKSVTADG